MTIQGGQDMENANAMDGLAPAGLVGWTIVRCDGQRCATCATESFSCRKLTMPGGQVCIWE